MRTSSAGGSTKTFALLVMAGFVGATTSYFVLPGRIVAGLTLADIAYLVAGAGGLLIALACLFAPMSPGKIPYVPLAMGFLIIAIACGHLAEKFTGSSAELLQIGMGVAIGLALGLFLGWGMQKRAESSK